MRQPLLTMTLCIAGLTGLSACDKSNGQSVDRAFQGVNVIDGTDLNEVMLTVSDPNEGVAYFQRSLAEDPDRIQFRRGLAISLIRAKRITEGVGAWKRVVDHEDATNLDKTELADAQIRAGQWEPAQATLNSIPPTHETFERYKLEAIIADYNKDWKKADSFYEIALGLTTKPAGVLNNWGFSKLTRGESAEAERLFSDAIQRDNDLFTAKNNLVLARGSQGNYSLPIMPMSQTERAELLHTMALAAIKRNDVEIGKSLLREAMETHPQHFEAAARSLDALENGSVN